MRYLIRLIVLVLRLNWDSTWLGKSLAKLTNRRDRRVLVCTFLIIFLVRLSGNSLRPDKSLSKLTNWRESCELAYTFLIIFSWLLCKSVAKASSWCDERLRAHTFSVTPGWLGFLLLCFLASLPLALSYFDFSVNLEYPDTLFDCQTTEDKLRGPVNADHAPYNLFDTVRHWAQRCYPNTKSRATEITWTPKSQYGVPGKPVRFRSRTY